jgi:phage FluMu protein Com
MNNLRQMLCPHCNKVFNVRQSTLEKNDKFKCSHCHKFNDGSESSREDGVLIGIVMSEKEKQRWMEK